MCWLTQSEHITINHQPLSCHVFPKMEEQHHTHSPVVPLTVNKQKKSDNYLNSLLFVSFNIQDIRLLKNDIWPTSDLTGCSH